MRHQGDSHIQERLIGDTLSDYLGRVNAGRDLWPGIRDRAPLRKRAAFPPLLKALAAVAAVSLIVVAAVVQPWFPPDSESHFIAVAHAYDGLFELETVRYRLDGNDSFGQRFVQLSQVDNVKRIHYSVLWLGTKSTDGRPSHQWVIVDGKQYDREQLALGRDTTPMRIVPLPSISPQDLPAIRKLAVLDAGQRVTDQPTPSQDVALSPGEVWVLSRETRGWEPFGDLGGLPWGRQEVEERFDRVERIGIAEVDGQPAVHYRAEREKKLSMSQETAASHYGSGRLLKNVYSGTDELRTLTDTLDLWVDSDDGRIIKADLMQAERAPTPSADFNERDWCQGLGEFAEAEYIYRLASGPLDHFLSFEEPEDSDSYEPARVICWNEGQTEGRVVWGRNLAEQIGEDFWVQWTFTFTALNEPLSLPDTLP